MGNVLRILKRDTSRLIKAPAALIVVGALMVLPSLYTWYNVVAFWNPYEATGNLLVSVVNQDVGAESELTGKLDVGDKVVEQLLDNERLHFIEQSYDDAIADLEAGNVYAVYVIPENFTECLISPLTGQVKSPKIVYYANEKLGPVSPKITDTAATTLDQTINSMFVATVSEAAVQAIDEAVGKANADKTAAQQKALAGVNAITTNIANVRAKLSNAQVSLGNVKAMADSALASLDAALVLAQDAKVLVGDIANEATAVQGALTSATSGAIDSLSGVASGLSQVVAKARTVSDGLLAKAGSGQALVDLGAGRVQPLIEALSGVSEDLSAIAAAMPDDSSAKAGIQNAADSLAGRSTELQLIVDTATALSARIEQTVQTASDAASTLDNASKQVSSYLTNYSDGLFGSVAPKVNSILSQVNSTNALLSTTVADLETTIGGAQGTLRQLCDLLVKCGEALAQTDALAVSLQTDVDSIASDIRLLAQSDTIADLVQNGSLNAHNIGEFMGSPTKIETMRLYHPNAYGTAMAPLFMNLTFWIGAFMLVIIFRTQVDDERIRNLRSGERYLGRFLLFAGVSVVQAVVCCAGVLALGVQVANVPALFIAAVMSALAYLSIIYALSTTLQHIGKALCIILVFAQIPGGSGLYPLELTDGFFQAIYPFLPFSYGIDALREAIGGFYGNFFVRDMAVLAAIFFGMQILGMVLVPLMSNVTRMASAQIREGDLYNGEDALVPTRPYRLSHLVGMLSDKEGFRENLERRYTVFSKLYPIFIRASIVLAVGVSAVLMFMLALDAGEKVTLLTVVVVWLAALLVFVLIVESLRSNFERQLNLERMSGESAFNLLFGHDRFAQAHGAAGALLQGAHIGNRAEPDKAFGAVSGITSDATTNGTAHDPKAEGGSDA